MTGIPRIFIVTGEASGDLHGAMLARELYRLNPELHIEGVGGQKMSDEGVYLIPDIDRVDAIGLPGMKQLCRGLRTLQFLKKRLQQVPYDVVVFIDSPGMNLRLAKVAANAKQHVVYYIAPQIWAWGKRRLQLIRRVVNRMIVILPFEESLYREAGVLCNFVGHPLLDEVCLTYEKSVIRQDLGVPEQTKAIGLLPGSRAHEVERCLPVMLAAVSEIMKTFSDLHVTIAKAESVSETAIHAIVGQYSHLHVNVVDDRSNEVMAASDLLFVASGTATLQAALIGTPMIVVYQVPWLTYSIARRLIKIPYVGLVNIVAGRSVVPELIQGEMTSERLAREALKLFQNPDRLERMRQDFLDIKHALGSPGASRRAAECILAEVQP